MKAKPRPLSSAAKGYGHRWKLARADFLRHHPLCCFCLEQGRNVPAVVVDHRVAHRLGDARRSGDAERIAAAWRLFWDRANWQPLCRHCHDSIKQRMEKTGRVPGCTIEGRPVDPGHHWNRPPPRG